MYTIYNREKKKLNKKDLKALMYITCAVGV